MEATARNPKISATLRRAFSRGSLGHQLRPPVSRDEPLLLAWLNWHGAEIFFDQEGPEAKVVGVFACLCEECYTLACEFVCRANVSLIAQGADEESIFRNSDDQATAELQPVSIRDQELEDRICERAALAARQVAEAILEGWRLKEEARAKPSG